MEDEKKKEWDLKRSVKMSAKMLDEKSTSVMGVRRSKDLGLCSNCSELVAVLTKFGSQIAYCQDFNKRLNQNDPVVECTKFWPYGQMTVSNMIGMAYIIELRRKVGFINDEEF